jgi:hypothetical protein
VRLWFYIIQGLANAKYAKKKISIISQLRIELLLNIIYYFSLVKAAMKAPCICKLRKNCFTGIDHCAMVISKHVNFFVSIGAFYDGKLRNEKNICATNLTAHI